MNKNKYRFWCNAAKGFITNYNYNGAVDELFDDSLLVPQQFLGILDKNMKEVYEGSGPPQLPNENHPYHLCDDPVRCFFRRPGHPKTGFARHGTRPPAGGMEGCVRASATKKRDIRRRGLFAR